MTIVLHEISALAKYVLNYMKGICFLHTKMSEGPGSIRAYTIVLDTLPWKTGPGSDYQKQRI